MAEARDVRNFNIERFQAAATVGAYEVFQAPSGKACFFNNAVPASSGDYVEVQTTGTANIAKATGFEALKGGRAYWDYSANNLSYKKVNDRDFYVGRFAQDVPTTGTFAEVLINADPPYDIDIMRDGYLSVLAGTAAAGGFGYPIRLGGALIFELSATSEAQKVDALSVDGFSKDANTIIEGVFRVLSDGAGTTPDISMGIAGGTHASDADLIAESVFIHLDGNNTNINAESDDGTTEVAATDTTIDYTEGGNVANRKEFWMDMRNPADVQIYIDGALVLPATVFNVNASVGPWFLLVHAEKTSGVDTYKLAIDRLVARFAEQ